MNQIRPWLYIGKYRETKDYPYLSRHNIGAMLLLAESVEQPGITSLYLPVEDGEPLPIDLLQEGLAFIHQQHEQGKVVLVACGAGISRSGSYAIAALKESENLGLLDAFQEVQQRHPDTMPHYRLWQTLCEYYGEAIPWIELHRHKTADD
ncbi:MAG: dual specificity protein phosphatase family protein [Anaerolineae bacterium]|nr:dual specificity protein phosphatase family protein [Anaerolineae bacterium]